ncbi:MAG: site-2 protease family protein [Oscillospiraceae bacterium]|nr:site-2 protease family protein [Oscillospiraceae bacterium]
MILRVLFSSATAAEKLSIILPQIAAVLVVVFLILPLHEWAHGFVAYKLGDDTAKRQGRLTFNPIASIDPIGALFILLFGFGWARPVPINPNNFKNRRAGMALTALAGPLANLVAALAGGLIYCGVFLLTKGAAPTWIYYCFNYYISINVSLAVFNLLPVPPLDGSKILGAFLPQRVAEKYYRYQNLIVPIAFILLMTGAFSHVLYYAQDACANGIMWLSQLPYKLFGLL